MLKNNKLTLAPTDTDVLRRALEVFVEPKTRENGEFIPQSTQQDMATRILAYIQTVQRADSD